MYLQIAQAVLGGLGGWLGNASKNATARANNMLSGVNAREGNAVRGRKNEAAAAQGALARFVQSVNNNRALAAGGNAQEALVVNALRQSDAMAGVSFSESIRAAEQAGHAAASQASAGVDGDVVDMVNTSTALRDSIVRQSIADNQDAAAYDASRRAGLVMSQMIGGLDQSVILDSLDYNVDVAQVQAKSSMFADVLGGALPGLNNLAGDFANNTKPAPKMNFVWNAAKDSQAASEAPDYLQLFSR